MSATLPTLPRHLLRHCVVGLALLVSAVCASGQVSTPDTATPEATSPQPSTGDTGLKISGFYSLTGLHLSDHGPFYAYIPYGDQGHGITTKDFDWTAASKAGLMVNGNLTPALSYGLQLMARDGADNASHVHTTQAYLEWTSGNWVAKAGRTVPGLWLVEDSYYADFGHLWLKAPVELYGWRPTPEVDGLSVARYFSWGDWYGKAQMAYGSSDTPYRWYRRRFREIKAFSLELSQGDLLLRAAINDSHVDIHNLPSYDAFLNTIKSQIPAQYAARFSNKNMKPRYISTGFTWTPNNWTVQGEWARYSIDQDYVAPFQASYLMVGHRWGHWTPYVMFSTTNGKFRNETRFSPEINAIVTNLRRTLHFVQDNHAVGVRYDINSKTAFKVQLEKIQRDAGMVGSFTPPTTGPSAPGQANSTTLLSVSLQGVF